MNDTVLDNGSDVWTLVNHSDGFIHYAIFRRDTMLENDKEFSIQFSKKTGGFGREVPCTLKVAREEWNVLVGKGFTRTHRQNRSVAPQQVASQYATMNPSNYALEA